MTEAADYYSSSRYHLKLSLWLLAVALMARVLIFDDNFNFFVWPISTTQMILHNFIQGINKANYVISIHLERFDNFGVNNRCHALHIRTRFTSSNILRSLSVDLTLPFIFCPKRITPQVLYLLYVLTTNKSMFVCCRSVDTSLSRVLAFGQLLIRISFPLIVYCVNAILLRNMNII